jgi:hypothetical protein
MLVSVDYETNEMWRLVSENVTGWAYPFVGRDGKSEPVYLLQSGTAFVKTFLCSY